MRKEVVISKVINAIESSANSKILFFCNFKFFIGDHIRNNKIFTASLCRWGKRCESSLKAQLAFCGGSTKLRLSGDSTWRRKKKNSISCYCSKKAPLRSLNFLINHEVDMENLLRHIWMLCQHQMLRRPFQVSNTGGHHFLFTDKEKLEYILKKFLYLVLQKNLLT